jgi:hypothetical protein
MNPHQTPSQAWRKLRLSAAILLLIGSGSASIRPAQLPESVIHCVPCHRTEQMDQVGEWLTSPYSASQGGLGCIQCHRTQCSGVRQTETFDGADSIEDLENLRRAVRLTLTATRNGDLVEAETAVTNVGAGHHLPTGSENRTLVLEVAAWGQDSEPLSRFPSAPPRAIRLAPFATDVSRHRFAAPEEGPVQVSALILLVSANGDPVEIANTATVCRDSALQP